MKVEARACEVNAFFLVTFTWAHSTDVRATNHNSEEGSDDLHDNFIMTRVVSSTPLIGEQRDSDSRQIVRSASDTTSPDGVTCISDHAIKHDRRCS